MSYAHSTALLRYAGKKSGIYPEDALEALKVDEIIMAGEEFFGLVFSCLQESPERQASKPAATQSSRTPE